MKAPHPASLWLFGPAVAWMAMAGGALVLSAVVPRDRPATPGAVVTSAECRGCHPREHASWSASHHSRMTQDAADHTVQAPFAGESVDDLGFRATMSRDPSGARRMRVVRLGADGTPTADPPVLDAEVVRTVGSHRYQQYLMRDGTGAYWRLPLAWHPDEARWIHMNGAFLEPDGVAGSAEDYLRHLNRWNDNCVFCHNTEPVPGPQVDGGWDTRVGELGIACEACHGRGGPHAARQRADPLGRLAAGTLRARGDPSVAHPERVGPARGSDICGRCHGQRIAPKLAQVLARGDGFRPGEALAAVSRPIFRSTSLQGTEETPFVDRFWPDGTPRLSAYEYQGLLLSPCWNDGDGLGCGHCHTMHGEEPNLQVRPDRRGSEACTQCHVPESLRGAPDHGGHRGVVDCLGCHMPRTTYGLLRGLVSHRITSPDPAALLGRSDAPDACTSCHVDRSRAWAAGAMSGLGLRGGTPGEPAAEEAWAPRVVLDLHGGDPIQRVLALHALQRPGAVGSALDRLAAAVAGLDDEYPVVRRVARDAARALAIAADRADVALVLRDFEVMAPVDERAAALVRIETLLPRDPVAAVPARRELLEARRDDRAIWIGE